jgi:hypothetical protein
MIVNDHREHFEHAQRLYGPPIVTPQQKEDLFFLLAASWAAVRGDSLCHEDMTRTISAIEKIAPFWESLQEPPCPK